MEVTNSELNYQQNKKRDIAHAFSRASSEYDDYAAIQRKIASAALRRCRDWRFQKVVDIGCGTGRHTFELSKSNQSVVGVDLSEGMVSYASEKYPNIEFLTGDAENLPLLNESVDAVFSSMALQWSAQPNLVLGEINRILKPGGTAELAIMIAGSFNELKAAQTQAGLNSTGNDLACSTLWLNSTLESQLTINNYLIQNYLDWHIALLSVLRSIKKVGAGTKLSSKNTQPTLTRSNLKKLDKAYKRMSARSASVFNSSTSGHDSLLPLTYRVLHLTITKETEMCQ